MKALHDKGVGRKYLLRSCAGLLALSTATQAFAADEEKAVAEVSSDQPTADQASVTSDGTQSVGLEEITVTAQRKSENLQKVPIVVDTLTGSDLLTRGVDSITQISAAVPNVAVTGSFNTNVYIRGVGANSASPNNEPSAAVYVDGVYIPSNLALKAFALNNIERLEVLKGPQGTLFGRNATAGVIQFITPDPSQEYGGNWKVGYGNFDTLSASMYVTGGLSDNLATDLAVVAEDQRHGWGYNPTFNTDIFWHNYISARNKWLFTPSAATKINLTFDYTRYRSDGGNNALVPGSIGPDKVTTFPGKYRAVGVPNIANDNMFGASGRIDQDLGSVHLASITSYRYLDGHWRADNDLGPSPLVQVDNYSKAEYVTEELQLSNQNPGWLSWVVGAFLYGNKVRGADPQANAGNNVAGKYRAMFGVQDTRSYSAFGQATAEILPATRLTLGLRYTDETLKARGRTEDITGKIVAGPFSDQISFHPLTWRAALDHSFTPDVLGYVSYNRGFKSGGYNLSSPGSAPFFPETVDAYEAGIKSTFFDHRVRLNIGGFYYDYKNLQVAVVPGGGSQIFTNAAAARNYGLDATLDIAATDRLDLAFDVGLLDAKYTDYPDAQGRTILGKAYLIPNAAGQTLPYAPGFSGNASATYKVPLSTGDLKATASVGYVGKTYVTPDAGLVRPAYTLVNASLEWRSHSWWGLRVWGKNLTNEYYYVTGIESGNGWYITPGAPRTYGVELLGKF